MTCFQFAFHAWRFVCLPVAGLSVLCLAGCKEWNSVPSPSTRVSPVVTDGPPRSDTHAEHAHASEGPHHGALLELGNQEFHAEVVHGKSGRVSVYILDSAAQITVPIDAAELTINITHDGKAEQFKLPAERDAADPEGKSSRFSLKDAELTKDLDSHEVSARLVVMINRKSYSVKITHAHDADHKH